MNNSTKWDKYYLSSIKMKGRTTEEEESDEDDDEERTRC